MLSEFRLQSECGFLIGKPTASRAVSSEKCSLRDFTGPRLECSRGSQREGARSARKPLQDGERSSHKRP